MNIIEGPIETRNTVYDMNANARSARSYLSDTLGINLPGPGANGVSIMDFEA